MQKLHLPHNLPENLCKDAFRKLLKVLFVQLGAKE